MKQSLVIIALIFASLALSTQSAVAGRIHNLTPVPVRIVIFWPRGAEGGRFALGPGKSSESLTYVGRGQFKVQDPAMDVTYCTFHKADQLSGGNYLVIGHKGSVLACTLCNSHRHQISRLTATAPYDWQGSTQMNCG